MSNDNPYAPPAAATEAPVIPSGNVAAEAGTLSLSGYGWEVVSDLAKWMRIVSGFLYVFGVIMVFVGLGFAACSSRLGSTGIAGAVIAGALLYAILLILGGTWLRRAATHFYEGVMGDAPSPLALGFRNLRLFLILYGVANLLGLGITVYQLLAK